MLATTAIMIIVKWTDLDCKGRLAKAWGLGGPFKHHSKLVYPLLNKP